MRKKNKIESLSSVILVAKCVQDIKESDVLNDFKIHFHNVAPFYDYKGTQRLKRI